VLRHGESTTNAAGVFTGLLDVELTDHGRQQAVAAARLLGDLQFEPRVVYASELRRAVDTTTLTVAAVTTRPVARVSVRRCSVLAERHYGALTGQTKSGVATLRALAAELAGLDTRQLAALRIATGEAIRCQVSSHGVQLSRLPSL
jgi:bisphosphoglycerate-dependent phosphoglycerate mutase